jgi:hypothetical protein
MKATTIFQLAIGLFIAPFLVFCFILLPRQAQAQDGDYQEPSGKFSQEELAQMLAPIALYPDALLSQVLMASSYPIEVVEADRWVRKNPGLKGEALDAALLDIDWDPSVKAVCHFPSILALMSERISETTNLGNAFLAQEAEVMDMVQELRAKAYAQNNLATNSRQKVIVENERIIIEPADPKVIYVSYYDPSYVYGPWWYPAYPPYYWGPPGVRIGGGISYWPGFFFGFAFGTWSHFDWHRHYIHMDVDRRPRFVRHEHWIENPGRWVHAPGHRRGVVYRDKSTTLKYGQYPQRPRDFQRDTRDFPEHRGQDRDRRVEDWNRIDRDKHRREDRTEIGHDRQERERVELQRKEQEQKIYRDRQERERADRDRQMREQGRHDRQERERVETERKAREQIDRDKQERQQIDRDRQGRERADRYRQTREQAERDRQGREGAEHERKMRERVGGDKQERQQIDRQKQEQERVELDRRERERVQREQQQQSNDNAPNRGDYSQGKRHSDDNDSGDRGNRGHNRP